jgi:hypothetical protein
MVITAPGNTGVPCFGSEPPVPDSSERYPVQHFFSADNLVYRSEKNRKENPALDTCGIVKGGQGQIARGPVTFSVSGGYR